MGRCFFDIQGEKQMTTEEFYEYLQEFVSERCGYFERVNFQEVLDTYKAEFIDV